MSSWRYIAQRPLTGEFLEWDIPMERDELSWALSGSGSLRGSLSPDVGRHRAADGRLLFEEWNTIIYAEADGEIRWGGILISSSFDDEKWTIEAAGFSTYPNGIPYHAEYSQIGVDPAEVFRHIWARLQQIPDSNLGVVIGTTTTPVRLGTPAGTEPDGNGGTREIEARPYELLWWENTDMGRELDSLAKDTPFDYIERHRWNDDGTVAHRIDLYYPRAGRKRDDLAFIQGDNVIDVVTLSAVGDDYANEVYGVGAGEGPASVRKTVAVRDGRLRRVAVFTDKSIGDVNRLESRLRYELDRRKALLEITSITVQNHPNAVFGSWELGDDILVQAEVPWIGEVSMWCRIVGWSLNSENTATLTLSRSDHFRYGVENQLP